MAASKQRKAKPAKPTKAAKGSPSPAKVPSRQFRGRGLRVSVDHPKHGRIEVRTMADRPVQLLSVAVDSKLVDALQAAHDAAKAADIAERSSDARAKELRVTADALAGEAKRPVWNQLAKPGHYKGHGAGEFTLDDKVFKEIVANFQGQANRNIAIDFGHASEQDPTSGSLPITGAPAQGWIKELTIIDGDLWGLVEWGDLARDYIRTGQYKYFSPAVRFGTRDRVTGKPAGARLSSGALTNDPFLDGMAPLAASNAAASAPAAAPVTTMSTYAYSSAEYMPKLRSALKLSELSGADEMSDEMDRLSDAYDSGQGEDVHGIPVGDRCAALRNVLGSPLSTTIPEMLDAVKAMIQAAIDEQADPDGDGDADLENTDGETAALTNDTTAEPPASGTTGAADMADAKEFDSLKVQLSTVEASRNELLLKCNAAEQRVTEAEAKLIALTAKLADADARELARKDAEETARHAVAVREYAIPEFLAPLARDMLRANPAGFEKQYPRKAADGVTPAALLSNMTGRNGVLASANAVASNGSAPNAIPGAVSPQSFRAMVDQVQKDNPQLSRDAAWVKAEKQLGANPRARA